MQGHVSHCVVDASNGEGGKGGCFINMDLHGQGANKMTSSRRLGGAEFVGPADCGCVVTPCCHMDMPQDHEVFQYQVVEEDVGHFKVGVGNVTLWVLEGDDRLAYGCWPWSAPDNGV